MCSPASSPPMPILWRPCPAPSHHGGHHLFWDSFSTNVWWQFQMAFSDWNFMLGSFYSSCLGNFMGIIHNSRATLVWVGVIIHLSTQLQTHLLSLSLSLSLFSAYSVDDATCVNKILQPIVFHKYAHLFPPLWCASTMSFSRMSSGTPR